MWTASGRQIYPLRGPVDLNHAQIVEKMVQTLVFPVRYGPVDIADFGRALKAQGATDIFAGTDNLVEVITGAPAVTVEEFTAANLSAFELPGQEASWQTVRAEK